MSRDPSLSFEKKYVIVIIEKITHRRFTGPLVHASRLTLERICYELGLVINERLLH